MTANGYVTWPLGNLLSRSEEAMPIDPTAHYKEVTIRLWGNGIVLRRLAVGSEIAAERRLVVRRNQFIVSRIDARNGAMGLVPDELDGAVVSNDFPAYDIASEIALPGYLGWLSKTHSFVDACRAASEGTTNRVRLQEIKFLALQIPLPPLTEQRRIVAKIERLAAKIDEASGIQKSSHAEADAIYYSVMHSIWLDSDRWMRASIGNLIELVSGQVDPRFDPYASLPHINGEAMESGTGRLLNNYRLAKDDGVTSGKYHFAPGAVLYSKIRPYLRKAVIVPFEGVCSADVYAIQMIDGRIDAGFLKYSLLSPSFTEYANDISGGCQS